MGPPTAARALRAAPALLGQEALIACRLDVGWWLTTTQDQVQLIIKWDDMDGRITKRQMALGASMVYGGLVAAMAALNYTDVMLIVVLVGGPVVAWAWYVASRNK